ncbi:hemagglutinin [Actinomyces minihominis]|uniref:hemagglutinin n=1 Tax=Actinomyces minihominis TaxID=2002838 RepID=UPI000C06AC44|nr:hemagglutinin [Actinomyces minihominis]
MLLLALLLFAAFFIALVFKVGSTWLGGMNTVDNGAGELAEVVPFEPEPMTPPLSYEGFNPANIISDEKFFDTEAYSLEQIEGFLLQWNQGCRTGSDGTPCITEYREDSPTFAADDYCFSFEGEAGDSAASIIWKAAHACNINPQVLLTTLQKEQGLITASGHRLNETRYTIAMGFACPDSSNCDPTYFGFATQVYYAARQFRVYQQKPEMFMTDAQREDFIPYAPGADCGGSTVFVENQATSNLYNYTPYQPNEGVFTGRTNSCSSVGNANFYAYFNAWFGTPEIAMASALPPTQSAG